MTRPDSRLTQATVNWIEALFASRNWRWPLFTNRTELKYRGTWSNIQMWEFNTGNKGLHWTEPTSRHLGVSQQLIVRKLWEIELKYICLHFHVNLIIRRPRSILKCDNDFCSVFYCHVQFMRQNRVMFWSQFTAKIWEVKMGRKSSLQFGRPPCCPLISKMYPMCPII